MFQQWPHTEILMLVWKATTSLPGSLWASQALAGLRLVIAFPGVVTICKRGRVDPESNSANHSIHTCDTNLQHFRRWTENWITSEDKKRVPICASSK